MMKWHEKLSRRERQVMDVVLAAGEATAAEVRERMPEAPSYSAVRALLRVMVEKGQLTYVSDGPRYVYRPMISPKKARVSALKQMLETFFNGSREQLVAALLDADETDISPEELDRLQRLIRQAKREGR